MLNIFTRISLCTADRVIAVSDFVKEYVEDKLHVPPAKIKRIYHGRDSDFLNLNKTEFTKNILDRFDIRDNYILSASKMVAYSNLNNLIKAFKLYSDRVKGNLKLVIAGGDTDKQYRRLLQDTVKSEGLEKKVRFLGQVSHTDMPALFKNAKLFAFPSTLEACPITLIEAMTAGSVIVTSNVEPMPEICKDAALYFNPYDVEDIISKLQAVIEDKNIRETLKGNALRRSMEFSWERSARETIEVLKGDL